MLVATIGMLAVSSVARADDPKDPSMRSAAARARDHELTRRLNQQQAAMVRERDARYAQGWRAYDRSGSNADYADANAQYERELARWRRDVSACRSGDYSACAH
ncbi:MAG: hypothetical protein KGJ57_02220 [Sphingomonadales bacterium]|nr:hypothetical protein [Sphingomonadales bacterium]MDE2168226.1 hypothetical protein [Sphingomonadales bacterium]